MPWFYANAGQQVGPVTDAEFDQLLRAGTIQSTTLVWREGMAEWQPYGTVGQTGAIACSICGKSFAPDAVVEIGGVTVCAQCKPLHLQRMREGALVEAPPAYRFAGFWIRGLASFIDFLLLFALSIGIAMATGVAFIDALGLGDSTEWQRRDTIQLVVDIFIGTIYETVLVAFFGGTVGKLICRIRVITAEGNRLSLLRSLARSLAEWISILPCGGGYVFAAFDKEKRALHDLICNTRVVWAKQT